MLKFTKLNPIQSFLLQIDIFLGRITVKYLDSRDLRLVNITQSSVARKTIWKFWVSAKIVAKQLKMLKIMFFNPRVTLTRFLNESLIFISLMLPTKMVLFYILQGRLFLTSAYRLYLLQVPQILENIFSLITFAFG